MENSTGEYLINGGHFRTKNLNLIFLYLQSEKSYWAVNCAYDTSEYYKTENYQAQNSFPVLDIFSQSWNFQFFAEIFDF